MAKTKVEQTTKQQWIELGKELKAAQASLGRAWVLSSSMLGTSHPLIKNYDKTDAHIKDLKSKLDDLVCKTFKEWQQAVKVFYGAEIPDENI